MQTKESQKIICKKCNDAGHFMTYDAPHVVRKYCTCEVGKRREEHIKKQIKTIDIQPVWELFTI